MKNKLLYLAAALGIVAAAMVFTILDQGTGTVRYHQHQEQSSELELGPCTDCGGEGELCTHLPIIRIETGGQKIPGAAILDEEFSRVGYELGDNGEEEILVQVSTVEALNTYHHKEDAPDLSSQAFVRYRGNTSRAFDKHGYQIKLVKNSDPEQNNNLPLMGMAADNEWALHGPFLDKTLLRNYLCMNLSADIMGYAPNVRLCELIVDGEYQGVYLLMETINEGENRVDLTDYQPGDPVCSYIVRMGAYLNPLKVIDNFSYYTYRMEGGTSTNAQIEILYPTLIDQTELVQDYVTADFSEIERILFSERMLDGSDLWKDYLDVDSFVDYYILQEFLMVNDAFSESTYFYRDVRGKLHIGPVWDYNNTLDNFLRPVARDEFLLSRRGWYTQLMTDRDFVEKVISRYEELRETYLSDAYLNQYIDETIAWLGSAVPRNFEVWGYTFDTANLDKATYRQPSIDWNLEVGEKYPDIAEFLIRQEVQKINPKSYDEAVDWMRQCIQERGGFMDRHIDSLRQFCSDSKNANRILH